MDFSALPHIAALVFGFVIGLAILSRIARERRAHRDFTARMVALDHAVARRGHLGNEDIVEAADAFLAFLTK